MSSLNQTTNNPEIKTEEFSMDASIILHKNNKIINLQLYAAQFVYLG